jgi:hypothetical protein
MGEIALYTAGVDVMAMLTGYLPSTKSCCVGKLSRLSFGRKWRSYAPERKVHIMPGLKERKRRGGKVRGGKRREGRGREKVGRGKRAFQNSRLLKSEHVSELCREEKTLQEQFTREIPTR